MKEEQPVFLNRAERRGLGKKYKIKAEPIALINKGPCKYCEKDVFVGTGQLYVMIGGKPSHKACRPY